MVRDRRGGRSRGREGRALDQRIGNPLVKETHDLNDSLWCHLSASDPPRVTTCHDTRILIFQ